MNRKLLSAVSAAALSMSLLAGVAGAQDLGLQQLQDSARISMARVGVETDMVDSLTLEELTRIEAVSSGTTPDNAKADQIEIILTEAEARIASGTPASAEGATGDVDVETLNSAQVLESSVGKQLSELGFNDVDVRALTVGELIEIELITGGSYSTDQQRDQIEQILRADG